MHLVVKAQDENLSSLDPVDFILHLFHVGDV